MYTRKSFFGIASWGELGAIIEKSSLPFGLRKDIQRTYGPRVAENKFINQMANIPSAKE
jgi:hypothetical protein